MALNVSPIFVSYQPVLCGGMATRPDPNVWEEITVITHISLSMQHCAVQATRKSMGMMALHERARLVNLTNLSEREEEDILVMPIVLDGLFSRNMRERMRHSSSASPGKLSQHLLLPRDRPSRRCSSGFPLNLLSPNEGSPSYHQYPHSGRRSGQATEGLTHTACQSVCREEEENGLTASSVTPGGEAEYFPFTCHVLECVVRALLPHRPLADMRMEPIHPSC